MFLRLFRRTIFRKIGNIYLSFGQVHPVFYQPDYTGQCSFSPSIQAGTWVITALFVAMLLLTH